MAVRFVSHRVMVNRFMDELGRKTITAACLAVVAQCKREARGGFKSGKFVTRGWQSIGYQVVKGSGTGEYTGLVGSTEKHFMFWEMGHHNLFTRQFEQNRWLTRGFQTSTFARDQAALAAAEQVAAKYSVPVSPVVGAVRSALTVRV